MVTGPHTTWAYVSDMDRAVAFYRDTLGLKPSVLSPYWSDFDLGCCKLGLHPGSSSGDQSGWRFGLACDDLKALRCVVENSIGRVVEDYHETPSGVVLTVADPDGNLLQLIQLGSKISDFSG